MDPVRIVDLFGMAAEGRQAPAEAVDEKMKRYEEGVCLWSGKPLFTMKAKPGVTAAAAALLSKYLPQE